MGQSLAIPRVIPNDWKRLDLIINKIKFRLGRDSSPTFAGLTLSGLTAGRVLFAGTSGVVSDDADLIWDNTNKRVGLRVAAPSQAFDMLGSLKLENTSSSTTGIIYKGANRFIHDFRHPTGDTARPVGKNVFIGENAGNFTMGGIATFTFQGSKNVGIGTETLSSNINGFQNMAIGHNALKVNEYGHDNVGLGVGSLLRNISGNYNMAIGYYSLGFNTDGSSNVAIGAYSMNLNGSGNDNTAIGERSGNEVSSSGNVFIGYYAGYNQRALGNRLILDNQDRGNAANELTDCLIYGIFNATVTSQSIRFNVGELILASGTPYQTLWNTTHEDSDGGRESRLNFKGEQSGGEETTLARIEVGHDGTGDDEKGYLDIFRNTGSDGDSPTKLIRVDSDGLKIGDGGITNYAQFETDGTLVFNGTATTFNDIVISLSSARVPAANAPTWDSFIGNLNAYAYAVNDFQEFSTELSHSYKNGVTIEFHIHGAVNGADGTDRTIKFEIEYTIADVQPESGFGDVYPATTTINAELTIPASTTDLTAFTIDIGDDTTGNFVQGAIVKGRIRRIASSGSEPSADPFLTEVGIHIESDTIGTRTAVSK